MDQVHSAWLGMGFSGLGWPVRPSDRWENFCCFFFYFLGLLGFFTNTTGGLSDAFCTYTLTFQVERIPEIGVIDKENQLSAWFWFLFKQLTIINYVFWCCIIATIELIDYLLKVYQTGSFLVYRIQPTLSLSPYINTYNLVTWSSLTSSCHPTLMEDKRRIWFCFFSLDRNFLDTLFSFLVVVVVQQLNNQLISHLIQPPFCILFLSGR